MPSARLRPSVLALALAFITTAVHAASLGDTLRTLASQAALSNPLSAPPLRPAPAWSASTTYGMGVVVGHGGKLYICRAGGTSAASGGPSGTGASASTAMYADIADGSAVWEYYGTPVTTTVHADAPTVSAQVTPPGDLTTHISPAPGGVPATTAFFFAGGTPTVNPNQPGTQVSFPCVTINASHTGGNVGLNNGKSNYHWSATFVTDAPRLALGVNFAPTPVNIIIDGRPLFPGGWQGVSGGNPSHFVLDFSAAGGRKARTITIEDYGNISFAGVWLDAASTCVAPVIAKPIRVAFFGSSIESGGNGFPLRGDLGWPAQTAKRLGWHDPRNLGLGGTGYLNNQGGTTLTYNEHRSDATSIAPDLVVIGGPLNDATQPPATLTAAAVAFLTNLRADLPGVPLIVLGTFPAASGPSALTIASENAVAAAVQQLADPRIWFVPLSTAPGGSFLTGTGNVGAPTGTGNADLYISNDGTHPDQPGIDFIAAHYATAISTYALAHIDAAPGGGAGAGGAGDQSSGKGCGLGSGASAIAGVGLLMAGLFAWCSRR